MEASESNRTTHTSPLEDQGISMQDIPYFSIVERLAHTNPVGQLPGPLSYKLLDQFHHADAAHRTAMHERHRLHLIFE